MMKTTRLILITRFTYIETVHLLIAGTAGRGRDVDGLSATRAKARALEVWGEYIR